MAIGDDCSVYGSPEYQADPFFFFAGWFLPPPSRLNTWAPRFLLNHPLPWLPWRCPLQTVQVEDKNDKKDKKGPQKPQKTQVRPYACAWHWWREGFQFDHVETLSEDSEGQLTDVRRE